MFDNICWLISFWCTGEDAPINDLVDFIIAAQVAVKLENDIGDSTTHGDEEKDEV